MLFSKLFALFSAMALAGGVAAAPMPVPVKGCGLLCGIGDPGADSDSEPASADRFTLGYRTVTPAQAKMYNKEGRITIDKNRPILGQQIGAGVYTTPGIGDWYGNGPKDWFCHITANKTAFDAVPKVWIAPQMWWKLNEIIDMWSRRMFPRVDPARSFRMSIIDRYKDQRYKQLLIPTALVQDAELDLRVKCKPQNQQNQLPKAVVDYYNWPNTFGTPQREPRF